MPDPNDPTQGLPQGAISPEEAESLQEVHNVDARGTEDEAPEKSSIQGAMEEAVAAVGTGPLKTYPISKEMRERLQNEFTYHTPRLDQIPRYNALRAMALSFAVMIVELTPTSREQSLALTKIGEAIMHANAAIARHEHDVAF